MFPAQLLGPGAGDVVRETVPAWLIPAFVVLTELGNISFLLVVFTLDHWFGDRRRGAHAIALAVAGMAVVTALKTFFVVPRPPLSVRAVAIDGYSFPSGHATAAAIGYGILAYDVDLGPRRVRYAVAGALVTLVALSRVVLGVHYVRDVVAGVAIGLAFLAAAIAVTRHDPARAFAVATGLSIVALVVSEGSQDSLLLLGMSGGATITWFVAQPTPSVDRRVPQTVLVAVVLPVLLGLGYLGQLTSTPDSATLVFATVLGAGVLSMPRLVTSLAS